MEVTLIVDPNFKAESDEQKAALAAAKARGPLERVSMVTARENIRLSGGLYKIKPEATAEVAPVLDLDAMSNDELKMMMLRIGVNPQKQMKRAEVIKAIRLKMEAVTITEDDA